mgnify:CR=1 FL=1
MLPRVHRFRIVGLDVGLGSISALQPASFPPHYAFYALQGVLETMQTHLLKH